MLKHAILIVAAMLAASTGLAGTISGTVSTPQGMTAGSVVYIDAIAGKTFAPPAKHAVMDQRDMKFVPHVLPVLAGTTVDFTNSDAVAHNVFSPDGCAPAFNLGTWSRGEVRSHTFDQPCKAVILCSIHLNMEAWVVSVPTPYFAATDDGGHYVIADVPDGRYRVTAWHETNEASTQDVVVSGATRLDFALK